MEVFALHKVVEMLEEGLVGWWEVRWIWQMRQNFIAQFIQLLKPWLWDMWSDIVMQNWVLSVDPFRLQALQFLEHLINLLSIFLRCSGFARIQEAVVDQTSSTPPNSDHDLFWCKFGFGKCFGASSWSNSWAHRYWLSYKIPTPIPHPRSSQFSSVAQSRPTLCNPMNSRGCQASLSITNSWNPPKPMSIESVITEDYFFLLYSWFTMCCGFQVYRKVIWLYINTEKAMAPHSNTVAWKIPWTEEPGRLRSMGSPRVGQGWVTSLSLFTFMHWRRKWQPTPVFLPGESQGPGNLVGCRLWGRTESDMTDVT